MEPRAERHGVASGVENDAAAEAVFGGFGQTAQAVEVMVAYVARARYNPHHDAMGTDCGNDGAGGSGEFPD